MAHNDALVRPNRIAPGEWGEPASSLVGKSPAASLRNLSISMLAAGSIAPLARIIIGPQCERARRVRGSTRRDPPPPSFGRSPSPALWQAQGRKAAPAVPPLWSEAKRGRGMPRTPVPSNQPLQRRSAVGRNIDEDPPQRLQFRQQRGPFEGGVAQDQSVARRALPIVQG